MPELPEVETVRDGLARHVLGRVVAEVEVLHPRAVRRQEGGEPAFVSRLVGCSFAQARRRGKYLWLVLAPARTETVPEEAPENPDTTLASLEGSHATLNPAATAPEEALLAHLGMSGQLLVRGGEGERTPESRAPGDGSYRGDGVVGDDAAGEEKTRRHLRVRLTFADGGELWFVDQRTFGHLMVTDLVAAPDADDLLPAPVAHIARDLLDPRLDLEALVRATRQRRTEIKRALLDQTLVSGIGNIYADEALWRARVHGERRTDGLAPKTLRRLYEAAADVMTEALAQGGTSFDALYVNVDGESGYFERSLDAYGRAGLPCRRCGTRIVRTTFMNRGSHFCPRCQRKRP